MKKVLSYMKPYSFVAVMTVVLTLIQSFSQLILPSLMAEMMNNGITQGNVDYIRRMGSIMLIITGASVITAIAASYCSSKTSTGFGRALRRAVFLKAESLSQSDIDVIGTSSLITRSTNDIRQIQDMVLMFLRMVISAPLMMIGGVILSFMMNKTLSTVIFIVIPIIAVIALVLFIKVMPLFETVQKKTDRLNQIVREKLSGIRVIRAFNKTQYEDDKFNAANMDLTGLALKINRMFAALIPIASLLLYGTIISLVWIGTKQMSKMDVVAQRAEIIGTVGNMQAFIMYLMMIIFAVIMAAGLFIMLPRASISAKRIKEVLELEPMIKDPESPETEEKEAKGTLEFRNVSFKYPGAEENIINNISFTSRAGETTAIIGGTGSGKSTLINLIPRFYDVTEGEILIDGVNIKDYSTRELHKKIGLIPQKAFLFSGSVAKNLRYGKEDATDEEIYKALEIAQARDFVDALPNKIHDRISQNGKNLSGGQKQRLAIARALVRNAEFYIFDDSFSALDFKTDSMLRAAIQKEFKNANLLIVAQRVGTILTADRIIVLDDGKVAGMGTHEELLESCAVYREIVESQLTKEELE